VQACLVTPEKPGEGFILGLADGLKAPAVQPLHFQRTEQRLTAGVPAVALAAHRWRNTMLFRRRPVFLSITHKLHSDHDAQFYVGEPRHASPDHGVARRIVCASEIAT